MSLEWWINSQDRKKKRAAASIGGVLVKMFGDVPLPGEKTSEQGLPLRTPQEKTLRTLVFSAKQIASYPDEITPETKVFVSSLIHYGPEGKIIPIFKLLATAGVERIFSSLEREIPIQYMTIGGIDKTQLLGKLKERSVLVSQDAEYMMASNSFTTLMEPEIVRTVRLAPKDIGLDEGYYLTTEVIYKRARQLGLLLSPAETGPHQRLVNTHKPDRDCCYIGMKQITGLGGLPSVFGLDNDRGCAPVAGLLDPSWWLLAF